MIEVRPLAEDDRQWAVEVETESWGEPVAARRGELVDLSELPAFIALLDGERAGLAAYAVRGDECEVVTITSLVEGRGIARALLDAIRDRAAEAGCRRLWLVTTNNNTHALKVFQRWGLDLVAFRRHAVSEARRSLKPSISERDEAGIPIAHELELELLLQPDS
jgi:ribosomal protein S18 acetylase RimI-like enzyme